MYSVGSQFRPTVQIQEYMADANYDRFYGLGHMIRKNGLVFH